jgi:DNA-binding NarL/FixJ family response regulator
MSRGSLLGTRILIVDDMPVITDRIQEDLADRPDLEIVGIGHSGESAVALTEKLSPDLILMDVEMPGMNGIEATRKISDDFPSIPILAFSMHTDRWTVQAMMEAGARGFISKDAGKDTLIQALSTLLAGETYFQ